MSEKQKYYITTAIAYTSGKPHIGNSYEIVLSDAIARFKRREGFDVFFQTGTDEHGQKIEEKAEKAGMTPQAFVDMVAGEIKDIYKLLNISYDKFIRTTDKDHERQVQKMFRKMYENGDIYKGKYTGKYGYEPNSNLRLPIFKPTRFEVANTSPGWLFKPSEKYDTGAVTLRPAIMPATTSLPVR